MKYAVLLAALAGPAWAEDDRIIAPAFAQVVASIRPEGFKIAFEDVTDRFYILESVPKGETVQSWSQMVTLTAGKGLAKGQGAAKRYASAFSKSYRDGCEDTFSTIPFRPPVIPGARQVVAMFVGCGRITGTASSEGTIVMVIAGKEDIYTQQWAERADASSGPVSFDMDDWKPRLARMAAVARVFDMEEAQKAP